jgi:hypothetical protein
MPRLLRYPTGSRREAFWVGALVFGVIGIVIWVSVMRFSGAAADLVYAAT